MKTITVTIGPDGSVKVEGSGFTGAACDKAMAEIERALGTETKRTKKPEHYQQQQSRQSMGH